VLNPGALTCGANPGSPVTDDYASPFKLTAAVHRRNGGRQRSADPLNEAEPRVHMARRQATGEEPYRGTHPRVRTAPSAPLPPDQPSSYAAFAQEIALGSDQRFGIARQHK